MVVIIAEKPSVAREIAAVVGATSPHRDGPTGFLEGNGYKVTWAFGHLVGLKSPEQMGFGPDDLPMFPTHWSTRTIGKRNKEGKEVADPIVLKQMKVIESLFSSAEYIIVATDAGREGELIFRYIYEHIGCRTPFRRLWISSLTEEAIRKGLSSIKDGNEYDNLSAAAHLRSQADWLVGFNASKMLRKATGSRNTLSLGRVQTPTLGMICERYEQFKNFIPVPYWQIKASPAKNGTAFNAISEKQFATEQDANKALNAAKAEGRMTVLSVEKKQTSTTPPLLYDLTALQRDTNKRHSLTAEETLKAAQSLYEKKMLSYPRTGSRYIPEDVFRTIPSLLEKFDGNPVIGQYVRNLNKSKLCRKSVNDSKVTDHHALLPTGVMSSDLTGDEKKIFELVLIRMAESFGENYVSDNTNVRLSCGNETYKAHGSTPIYAGWKAVRGTKDNTDKENDKDEDENTSLPDLKDGDILQLTQAEVLRKETRPKPIHDDSSLLGEMETCGKHIDDEQAREAMKETGIGTQATRAAIIEALIKRDYVTRDKKKLIPTSFGMQIWEMVKGRRIADVQTTGEWEHMLGLVEKGQKDPASFDRGIRDFVEEILSDLKQNCHPINNGIEAKCPFCGTNMKDAKWGIACPSCDYKIPKTLLGKKIPEKAIKSLLNGKATPVISGFTSKTGKKFDAALVPNPQPPHNIGFDFGTKNQGENISEKIICPCCGNEMEEQPSKLSCNCGFTLWKTSLGVRLTPKQIKGILSGETVRVDGMKSKNGKIFSAGIKLNIKEKKTEFEF